MFLCVGKKNSDDFTIGITDPKGSSDILKLNEKVKIQVF